MFCYCYYLICMIIIKYVLTDISNSTKEHLDIESPYDVTLAKQDKEGFGFVVISSLNKGPTIGKKHIKI